MNILITGRPGIGKTTVVRRLGEMLGDRAGGFYTQELREHGRRIGFDIVAFGGGRAILAREGFSSPRTVGKYGVEMASFEKVAIPSLVADKSKILIIDEIGKMELFSERFREAVLAVLDSPTTVVACIIATSHPFADAVKSRKDCAIFEVNIANRDELPRRIYDLCTG